MPKTYEKTASRNCRLNLETHRYEWKCGGCGKWKMEKYEEGDDWREVIVQLPNGALCQRCYDV